MVKVVEEFASSGRGGGTDDATGANSTSPRGPRNIGLAEDEVAAIGGVGTILGGVKPWWLSNRVG